MSRMRKVISCMVLGACIMFIGAPALQSAETITYWSWGPIEPEFETFMQRNPTIKVDFTSLGPWDINDKFLVSLAAGTGGPDVVKLVLRRFSYFMETGALYDLTDEVAPFEEDFVPAVWGMCRDKGRVYGMPGPVAVAFLWYRKDLFSECGIRAEDMETWEDYIDAGKKLKAMGIDMLPVFIPSGQWGANYFKMFLQSRGGLVYDKDGKFIEDNQLLIDTLQWYYDLYDKHEIATPMKFFTPEMANAFKNDELASWPMNTGGGTWNLPEWVPEQAGKWDFRSWLRWKERDVATTGQWGGEVWAIPDYSEKKDEALTFILYVTTTTEGVSARASVSREWTAYIPAQSAPIFREPLPFYGKSYLGEMLSISPFYCYSWAETADILGGQLEELFAGKVTAEEAYANLRNQVKEKLGR